MAQAPKLYMIARAVNALWWDEDGEAMTEYLVDDLVRDVRENYGLTVDRSKVTVEARREFVWPMSRWRRFWRRVFGRPAPPSMIFMTAQAWV